MNKEICVRSVGSKASCGWSDTMVDNRVHRLSDPCHTGHVRMERNIYIKLIRMKLSESLQTRYRKGGGKENRKNSSPGVWDLFSKDMKVEYKQ